MKNLKNSLCDDFWNWLDFVSIKYKNYEIKNAIIVHKYLQYFQIIRNINDFDPRRFLSSIKWKLKLNLLMGKMPNQNMFFKRNYDSIYDLSCKNVYAINFSPKNSRHFLHIAPLAENDKNSLVITVRDDVYEYFNKLGIQSILLDIYSPWRKIKDLKMQTPKVQPRNNLLFSLDIFSLILLSRAASLIDLLDILINKKGLPRALITLQDFHAFDSVFASYFLNKIPTITLQHGRAGNPKDIKKNLWKYIISDWMVVFSSSQAKIFESMGVNSKKIRILGSAKYDLYIDRIKSKLKNNKNKRVLLSIQEIMLSKKNSETMYNFVKYLLNSKEHFILSIRFHSEVEKSRRKKFMQKLGRENIFSPVILEISKNKDPLKDISESTIVLVFNTTLAIEAMLLKKPVIEYLSKKEDSVIFGDYRDFSLHALGGEEAKKLIIKLFEDNNFYKEIIKKQNRFINTEIMPPPAIPRILDFIYDL